MNAQEELELPPWEKFIRYKLFPYKMLMHISLVIIVTTLVVISNITFAGYSRSMWSSTINILFPNDFTDYQSDLNSPYQYYIYTQNQTIENSNKLVFAYFELPLLSVNNIQIYNSSSDIRNPEIEVVLLSGTTTYIVESPTDTGGWPLSYYNLPLPDQRAFFNDLQRMNFRFFFRSHAYSSAAPYQKDLCFNWELLFTYDMASAGQILVTGHPYVRSQCGEDIYNRSSVVYGLFVAVFVLAAAFQLLLLKAVWRQLIILNAIRNSSTHRRAVSRGSDSGGDDDDDDDDGGGSSDGGDMNSSAFERPDIQSSINNDEASLLLASAVGESLGRYGAKHSERQMEGRRSASKGTLRWPSRHSMDLSRPSLATVADDMRELRHAVQSLTWRDRFRIVNLWFLVSSFGNIFGLFCAARVVFFLTDLYSNDYLKNCLGVSCLMFWFSLSQYLEYFPRYYVMISMLKITVPRVSQFLLGVLPLFVGYALLGMVCFGDVSDRFGNITETLRTLFAIVNGDVIYDNFNAIDYFTGVGGQAYLYFYILLFTYVVLMTIIAIVEEAFFAAQNKKSKNDVLIDEDDQGAKEREAETATGTRDQADAQSSDSSEAPDEKHRHSPAVTRAATNTSTTTSSRLARVNTLGKKDLPDHLKLLLQNVDRQELLRRQHESSLSQKFTGSKQHDV